MVVTVKVIFELLSNEIRLVYLIHMWMPCTTVKLIIRCAYGAELQRPDDFHYKDDQEKHNAPAPSSTYVIIIRRRRQRYVNLINLTTRKKSNLINRKMSKVRTLRVRIMPANCRSFVPTVRHYWVSKKLKSYLSKQKPVCRCF